jgi:protein TonB
LAAVRQWQFEPPSYVPMLIVTDVGVGEDDDSGGSLSASSARGPVAVGGDIQPPRRLVNVPPVYPPEAIKARITGIVSIEAVISPSGDVSEARVISGVPGLDDSALAAVRQWKYSPTLVNGEPVAVVMTVSVNFSLGK